MDSFSDTVFVVLIGGVAAVLIVTILLGRRIEAKIGSVHFELKPNGGRTLRDAIDRIEWRVETLEERTQVLEEHDRRGDISSGE